jgi:hypothetical protein
MGCTPPEKGYPLCPRVNGNSALRLPCMYIRSNPSYIT